METTAAIESLFREHHGRILAALIRILGDFDLAEDALQDACIAAMDTWPRDELSLAVEVKATGEMIGVISLHDANTDNSAFGYCYARAHWGKGYGTEAARALADVAFNRLGHRRIWATCDARNHGSYAIMEKVGMRREGHLLKNTKAHDGWRDSYVYALLADEWRAANGQ